MSTSVSSGNCTLNVFYSIRPTSLWDWTREVLLSEVGQNKSIEFLEMDTLEMMENIFRE